MIFLILSSDSLKLLDKVIAVVNDEPIFYSELEEAYRSTTLQENDSIKNEILKNFIKQRVILVLAKNDSSLSVSEEEFKNFSKNYIDNIYFQYGRIEIFNKIQSMGINPNDTIEIKKILKSYEIPDSLISFSDPELANKVFLFVGKKIFDEELKKNNLTIKEFIENQREFIKKQILIQKYISKYIVPEITITEDEIKNFYETHKDSFPKQPNIYYLEQIVIPVSVSFEQEEKAYDKIKEIYKKLQKGENFDKLAKKFSDDSIIELGWLKKNYLSQLLSQDLILEIFSTPKGSWTRPIRTPLGYNIFKVNDKSSDSVKLSHILIKVKPSKEDIEKAREKVLTILESAKKNFEETAKENSFAPTEIGYVPENAIPNDLKPYFKDVKENSIIGPIYKDGFYLILRVKQFIPEKITKYEDVREQIKFILMNKKIEEKISEIYEKNKDKVLIKIYK
ncbi:MAG: peptidyl-prolyl cis-trans isomerase [candidate division WOR-3 bacterium]